MYKERHDLIVHVQRTTVYMEVYNQVVEKRRRSKREKTRQDCTKKTRSRLV